MSVSGFGASRPMMSININSGNSFTTRSVSKMGDIEFGLSDGMSTMKVTEHAKNGRPTPNGNFLFYLSGPTGLMRHGITDERPMFRCDMNTGLVIQYYDSIADVAMWVKEMELCRPSTSLRSVGCNISRTCSGHEGRRSAYGYKWCDVRDDQRPENLPLPPVDENGL